MADDFNPQVFDPSDLRMSNIYDPTLFAPGSTPIPTGMPGSQTAGDDITQKLVQVLSDNLQKPDSEVSRMKDLLEQYPQRKPAGLLTKIAATVIGAGYGPKAAQDYVDTPYQKELQDWTNKFKAQSSIAADDIKNQLGLTTSAVRYGGIVQGAQDRAKKLEFDYAKLQDENTKAQNALLEKKREADLHSQDLGKQRDLYEARLAAQAAQHALALAEQQRMHDAQIQSLQSKEWTPMNIPDPDDPTKTIGVLVGKDGTVKRVSLDDQQVGAFGKPGAATTGGANQLTQTTRAMMEGAQMLRPHVPELNGMAIDLNRRGLFGPIMSRIRDYAAKIGTTGSPEEVKKSLDEFANAITQDPLINQSNDFAVGQFTTALGLMASGMGRVHGQARGGGSIQMIQYMKSLLSSDSTLSMFQGRLNTLDNYLKGYAAGPKPQVKTKLDKALDNIFGPK